MLQQGMLLVGWCDGEVAYLHLVPIAAALALMIGFWFGLVWLDWLVVVAASWLHAS